MIGPGLGPPQQQSGSPSRLWRTGFDRELTDPRWRRWFDALKQEGVDVIGGRAIPVETAEARRQQSSNMTIAGRQRVAASPDLNTVLLQQADATGQANRYAPEARALNMFSPDGYRAPQDPKLAALHRALAQQARLG